MNFLDLSDCELCVRICRAEAFKQSTERLVNDLTRAAAAASEKLSAIEERSDQIIQESSKLHGSMSSIVSQTEHLSTASNHLKSRIGNVLDWLAERAVSVSKPADLG